MKLSIRTDRSGQTSVNSDQAAPEWAVWSVYTVCHSIYIFWMHYCMVKPQRLNFRIITASLLEIWILRIFTLTMLFCCKSIGGRATENRFFAGLDRFLVCKTDSVCIKCIFFGPKKHTLRIIYWPNYLDKSSVKPLISHNYSNYQCCQHIGVTKSWKIRSRLITLPLAII